MSALFRTSLLCALVSAGTLAQAEIYKWVDSHGKIHYTQTPPSHQIKAEDIGDRIRRAAGKATLPRLDLSEFQNDFGKSSCEQNKQLLNQLKQHHILKWRDDEGEQTLKGHKRQEKIDQITANIKKQCQSKVEKQTAGTKNPSNSDKKINQTTEAAEALKKAAVINAMSKEILKKAVLPKIKMPEKSM